MEITLAVVMVLGVFVAIPALVGFAIAGAYILRNKKVRRVEHADTLKEVAVAEDTVGVAKA